MNTREIDMNGLGENEAIKLQKKYGKNELIKENKQNIIIKIMHTALEPMFLLLLVSSIIYFLLGEAKDGMVMLVFIIGMITIDIIQELKTDKTLKALKKLSSPKIKVIREGKQKYIDSTELVPGDLMIIHEGVKVPADGFIIKCSGLKIDESTLTGEAQNVVKSKYNGDQSDEYFRNDYCYAGTLVTSGTGIICVDKISISTEYGKISKTLKNVKKQKTTLEKQTDKLVKICAIIALILFIIVSIVTFLNIPDHSIKDRLIESILSGVTLAMAMIPEEFPVILTVFLSMGAWRLAKKKSLVKKLPSVETLGAVSILCVDKTGTITKNEMSVKNVYSKQKQELSKLLIMSSMQDAFDPMEKAMFKYSENQGNKKDDIFNNNLVKEYAFSDNTKMMANVWNVNKELILASKGSPESIIKLCNSDNKNEITQKVNEMSSQGLRVIAVAKGTYKNEKDLPDKLENAKLEFIGLVGLIDPPKDNIKKDIELCYKAGIRLVMITGDNGVTASAIAKSIGMKNCDNIITGREIDDMTDDELKEKLRNVSIFSRVIPLHKMRIVNAFKELGETVAMTGDGVNDASALKYADIGIAMGKRGSEVSREAADLILMDDNFSTIIDTVKDGRRIYDNIKRAIKYIFTIHIPIAGASLLAPLLSINPSSLLFLPIHVVIMELVIDPTSSIVLERIPAEDNIMQRKPRKNNKLICLNDILSSVIQGIILFTCSFALYYYCLNYANLQVNIARTMGILCIIIGNLFIVHVNASETNFAIASFKKLLKDKIMWVITIFTIFAILIGIYSPINGFLKLGPLSFKQFLITLLVSFVSVFWYEIVKLIKKIRH